jgi:hypothetical protein
MISVNCPYIGILEEQYILDFMKSTNDIKLESTLLPYDSFWCSVLMIICSPWYCLFIKMIYRIIKLDNIREIALIMYTYN